MEVGRNIHVRELSAFMVATREICAILQALQFELAILSEWWQ